MASAASASSKRVALVTGANKGLGYHLVSLLAKSSSDLTVLLGSRDAARGAEAVKTLNLPNVHALQVDVDDKAQLAKAAEEIKTKYGGLDLLVNNAGIYKGEVQDVASVDATFRTNYHGVLDAIDAFLPLVRESGRIVNTSSGAGLMALGTMPPDLRAKYLDDALTIPDLTALLTQYRDAVADGSWEDKKLNPKLAYHFSKAAVSILTKILARNLPRAITINAVCPGWCRTELGPGNKAAPRSAEEGAETLAYVCLLPAGDKTTGQFFEPAQPEAGAKISSLARKL